MPNLEKVVGLVRPNKLAWCLKLPIARILYAVRIFKSRIAL
jgi:hypothetical protein